MCDRRCSQLEEFKRRKQAANKTATVEHHAAAPGALDPPPQPHGAVLSTAYAPERLVPPPHALVSDVPAGPVVDSSVERQSSAARAAAAGAAAAALEAALGGLAVSAGSTGAPSAPGLWLPDDAAVRTDVVPQGAALQLSDLTSCAPAHDAAVTAGPRLQPPHEWQSPQPPAAPVADHTMQHLQQVADPQMTGAVTTVSAAAAAPSHAAWQPAALPPEPAAHAELTRAADAAAAAAAAAVPAAEPPMTAKDGHSFMQRSSWRSIFGGGHVSQPVRAEQLQDESNQQQQQQSSLHPPPTQQQLQQDADSLMLYSSSKEQPGTPGAAGQSLLPHAGLALPFAAVSPSLQTAAAAAAAGSHTAVVNVPGAETWQVPGQLLAAAAGSEAHPLPAKQQQQQQLLHDSSTLVTQAHSSLAQTLGTHTPHDSSAAVVDGVVQANTAGGAAAGYTSLSDRFLQPERSLELPVQPNYLTQPHEPLEQQQQQQPIEQQQQQQQQGQQYHQEQQQQLEESTAAKAVNGRQVGGADAQHWLTATTGGAAIVGSAAGSGSVAGSGPPSGSAPLALIQAHAEVSGRSNAKLRLLQQHIDELTSEKLELMRGLQQQARANEALAEEVRSLGEAHNALGARLEAQAGAVRRAEAEAAAAAAALAAMASERDAHRTVAQEATDRANVRDDGAREGREGGAWQE